MSDHWNNLAKALPPIVFRNWKRWNDFIPFTARSVANFDSAGTGPSEKLFVGKVCGYPRESFVKWLKERSEGITERREKRLSKLHNKIHEGIVEISPVRGE